MTENDPSAPHGSGEPREPQPEQPAQEDVSTPPRGTSFGGEQQQAQPSPWSAPAQQQAYPWTSPQQQTAQHQQGLPYSTATFPAQQQPIPQQRRGSGRLVAGVAVLALVVGGAAGGAGGYFASQGSGGSGSSYNALNQPVPSQQTSAAPAGSVESVAQKVSPSVVELVVSGSQEEGEGSGFVLSTDGFILTNNHVVEVAANGGSIQAVFPDGTKADASIVGRDPTTDVAVVKVQGVKNLTPVALGNSDATQVGQQVVAFGSPFELAGTVTSGIVSALHRPVRAGGSSGDQTTVMSAIQTDAAINPGNSGGPLVNLAGQVIGIDSAIYSPQSSGGLGQQQSEATNAGIGFAIPINQARRTAQEIIDTGKATQTYIGATVSDAQAGGAMIQQVQPGSPAEQAGLKSGDVVTKVDNLVINDSDGLIAAIRTRAPNDKVTFTLSDNRSVQVTLGGQPVQVN
ncbi:trypsin-like peptidase domain-containing protein [Amycolatopsis acidiphila]|uniref:PDZ domain-containing protein n=1 Tax=Amycolatopsis acidiphila TaxID=715473 RepID=A0A558A817_9PSEU|nr:trypsin-like peptidase domain-containing protein [Amycolatopsis acidiphila]TVT20388.1 PDZ domain-containing protein [Amycolatopsis acidiphila]UIJ59182.1 trypsin-like peptidase domain-containing protein [Amycolatopsis acidiphila]